MSDQRKSVLTESLWVLFWVALSSIWCLTAANRLSATFDEPFDIECGLKCWRTGSFKCLLDVGTMPFPSWFETAPLYVWERWRGQPFDAETEMATMLPVARTTALVFWWLLLGYGWAAGRQLAGKWGGRLAIAILACEPTLLSNAALALTDVAVAACLLALFVHYRASRSAGFWRRVAVPSVWFALAIVSKTSGLVFGVMGMGLLEIEHRLRNRTDLTNLRERARAVVAAIFDATTWRNLTLVFWLGLLGVFVFCGSEWKPSPSFQKWAQQQPAGFQGDCWRWAADHLCIFSNAGNGLAYQIRRNFMSQQTYLLGSSHNHSLWYYFPVSLSMKEPIAFLLLPVLLIVLAPRSLGNWSCALAGVLLLFSLNCRIQLSVRYMTPLITMACVGLAAALAQAIGDAAVAWRRRVLSFGAAAVSLSMVWVVWSSWPNALCYVNEFWGGPERGYILTCDYDWGQGLKELRAWQQKSGADSIDVIYFGTDPRARYEPFHAMSLVSGPANIRSDLRSPYLAVGTSALYHPHDADQATQAAIRWLRPLKPVARTSTFLIYDVRELDRGLADLDRNGDLASK